MYKYQTMYAGNRSKYFKTVIKCAFKNAAIWQHKATLYAEYKTKIITSLTYTSLTVIYFLALLCLIVHLCTCAFLC